MDMYIGKSKCFSISVETLKILILLRWDFLLCSFIEIFFFKSKSQLFCACFVFLWKPLTCKFLGNLSCELFSWKIKTKQMTKWAAQIACSSYMHLRHNPQLFVDVTMNQVCDPKQLVLWFELIFVNHFLWFKPDNFVDSSPTFVPQIILRA